VTSATAAEPASRLSFRIRRVQTSCCTALHAPAHSNPSRPLLPPALPCPRALALPFRPPRPPVFCYPSQIRRVQNSHRTAAMHITLQRWPRDPEADPVKRSIHTFLINELKCPEVRRAFQHMHAHAHT
jgi:hypothetical protein